jgi:hypothetical protein
LLFRVSTGVKPAAFARQKGEFDAALDRLQELSADFFNLTPDEITWGHAGMLAHYNRLLREMTDAAFREGEFAED